MKYTVKAGYGTLEDGHAFYGQDSRIIKEEVSKSKAWELINEIEENLKSEYETVTPKESNTDLDREYICEQDGETYLEYAIAEEL